MCERSRPAFGGKEGVRSRQTVGARAGVSQLPVVCQKDGRWCLPLLDRAGKKQIKQCLGSQVCIGNLKDVGTFEASIQWEEGGRIFSTHS